MPFTVIIATAGRPERLAVCLSRVRDATARAGNGHRVIVVDNDPAYSAGECVRQAVAGGWTDLVYLRSAPRNKALALNEGIRAARTDWLAFTDDDTLPEAAWLENAGTFIQQNGGRVFGGRILAGQPERPLPYWLRPGRSGLVPQIGVVVEYDPMPASGLMGAAGAAPFGANVFVKREIFENLGGYDEPLWDLCRARWPLGSEDSEFGYRLRTAGEPIGYCREAVVIHPVNHDRCSLGLHFTCAYDEGWRRPLIFYQADRPLFQPYLARMAAVHAFRAAGALVRADVACALFHLVEAVRLCGIQAGRWSKAYRMCSKWRKNGWQYPRVAALSDS